jgi:predicted RNA-binding protein YlqC (UPF0109 family)
MPERRLYEMIRSLIEELVKSIVDNPNMVEVTETKQDDGALMVGIKVADADLGKVIGRNGQTIKAIRAVAHALNQTDHEIKVDIAS